MSDEVTDAQARIIFLLIDQKFRQHVEVCSDCEWKHEEDEDILIHCERAWELEQIASKWRLKALHIRTLF